MRVERRYGIGGYDGPIADTLLSYSGRAAMIGYSVARARRSPGRAIPTPISAMIPRIGAQQSAASGLPVYTAGGGVVSYGLNAGLTAPITRHIGVALFTGYDWLGGAVVNSSLVQQRGRQGQFSVGLGVGYRFGWN